MKPLILCHHAPIPRVAVNVYSTSTYNGSQCSLFYVMWPQIDITLGTVVITMTIARFVRNYLWTLYLRCGVAETNSFPTSTTLLFVILIFIFNHNSIWKYLTFPISVLIKSHFFRIKIIIVEIIKQIIIIIKILA